MLGRRVQRGGVDRCDRHHSVFNLMVTLALPVLGVIALLFVATPTSSEVLGAVGGLVAVGVMVGFFAAVLHSDATAERLGSILERIAAKLFGLIRKDPPSGITDQLVTFRRSTVDIISRRWAVLTGTNFLQQFAQFGVLMVSLRITEDGKTTQVAVIAAFAAFAMARLASFIPITPGGLGTVDAALTSLLVAFARRTPMPLPPRCCGGRPAGSPRCCWAW
jgi:uncharacterized membrane protein YbhN (UPF0104 family)